VENKHVTILVVSAVRELFLSRSFCESHRTTPQAFTRRRKLPFSSVMLMVLQKSLKSLQLRLHEFFEQIAHGSMQAATPGAYTQARAKLSHRAFVELNQVALLGTLESCGAHRQCWQGHRLLAIDSSLMRLPGEEEIWKRFGGQEPSNQSGNCGMRVPMARLSVLYDVLNRLGLETRLEPFAMGEIDMAGEHLHIVRQGDVCLLDRGFAGYELFARILTRRAHFLVRCPRRSFGVVSELFAKDEAGVSLSVWLKASAQAIRAGLPSEIKVRFVTLRLPTGELEVLATSLLDEEVYPTPVFGWVYSQRWGIETFYGVLKGRLDLENFSGLSVESVLQDVHAAVFLSNLESVVAAPVASRMPAAGRNGRKHGTKINRAVSFHAIKSRMFDLLLGPMPVEQVVVELHSLLRANPVAMRPGRGVPRKPPSALRSLHHQRRVKKIVY
jgi:Transposase DDE domain